MFSLRRDALCELAILGIIRFFDLGNVLLGNMILTREGEACLLSSPNTIEVGWTKRRFLNTNSTLSTIRFGL